MRKKRRKKGKGGTRKKKVKGRNGARRPVLTLRSYDATRRTLGALLKRQKREGGKERTNALVHPVTVAQFPYFDRVFERKGGCVKSIHFFSFTGIVEEGERGGEKDLIPYFHHCKWNDCLEERGQREGGGPTISFASA